ncbi:MAG: SpoIIE family protein phosphatase [Phycisphaera sp.]|nr:SpoIIE family protein phosphatase [Phycisphaera sp.]
MPAPPEASPVPTGFTRFTKQSTTHHARHRWAFFLFGHLPRASAPVACNNVHMLRLPPIPGVNDHAGRLEKILRMVREMSQQTEPLELVNRFGEGIREFLPVDGYISLSIRDIEPPRLRITRYSGWEHKPDPWNDKAALPIIDRGMFSDLIYAAQPRLIHGLQVDDSDPAKPYLEGFGSMAVIPHFHEGQAKNMAIALKRDPDGFDEAYFPEFVLIHNLFGRVTNNLVLTKQLAAAHKQLDEEMRIVGDIQRSLLPQELPEIPNFDIAAYYQTAHRAGGDYYDLFPLPEGRWGLLIADVSGHGTPAAVVMAATHAMAHAYPGPDMPPSKLLTYLNDKLIDRYNTHAVMFVTAFYGVIDPRKRTITYSSAGHNPPRLRRGRELSRLDEAVGVPLGVLDGSTYEPTTIQLEPNDVLLCYTDGVTETFSPDGRMFGEERMDRAILANECDAKALIGRVLAGLRNFEKGLPVQDDRTLVALRVK